MAGTLVKRNTGSGEGAVTRRRSSGRAGAGKRQMAAGRGYNCRRVSLAADDSAAGRRSGRLAPARHLATTGACDRSSQHWRTDHHCSLLFCFCYPVLQQLVLPAVRLAPAIFTQMTLQLSGSHR